MAEDIITTRQAEQANEALLRLWEQWQVQWREINPPPARPQAARRGLHWTVWLMLGSAVSGAIGVSLRTAQAFYAAAQASGADGWLAFVEALAFVLGVEGGMAAFGFRHAYRMALAGKARQGRYARFLTWARWGGLLLLVVVSVAAGLWQALALGGDALAGARDAVLLWLAGAMGAGMSVAVFLLFEFAGAEAAEGIVLAQEQHQAWEQAMRQWRTAMREAFERRPAVRRLQALASGTKALGEAGQGGKVARASRPKPAQTKEGPALRRALEVLRANGEAEMSVRQLAHAANVSVGTAQKALQIWRASGGGE